MSAGTMYIDKIKFCYICNIFIIGKIRAIFSNFAVLRCELNGHFPDIISFFFQKCFP